MILPESDVEIEGVARHYDEVDEFYREVWGEHVHHGLWETGKETPEQAVELLVHSVAQKAGISDGMAVCDIGCGYGGTSRILASQYGARVTGLTVSEAQFEHASKQTTTDGNPQFLLCPWEENPFADGSFEAAVSIECVSHVRDKENYFCELQRVLKPGAQAVVIAWLANAASGRMAKKTLLIPICTEGRLPGMATAAEYRDMISSAGLELHDFQEVSRQVRKTWWICIRRTVWNVLTKRKYIRALLDRNRSNRVFAITLFRILIAYYTGSMQYGIFVISKPKASEESPKVRGVPSGDET